MPVVVFTQIKYKAPAAKAQAVKWFLFMQEKTLCIGVAEREEQVQCIDCLLQNGKRDYGIRRFRVVYQTDLVLIYCHDPPLTVESEGIGKVIRPLDLYATDVR